MLSLLYVILFLFHASSVVGHQCNPITHVADRRADQSKLTVMQFNPDWVTMSTSRNWAKSERHGWHSPAAALNHLQKIADIIKTQADAPDIIVLEEVAGCEALTEIINRLGAPKKALYKPYLKESNDMSLHQHIGIITKIDPTNIWPAKKYTRPGTTPGTTDVFNDVKMSKFRFKISGLSTVEDEQYLDIFGVHFRAGPNKEQRETEAKVVRNWIKFAHDDPDGPNVKWILVVGDFNDYDELSGKRKIIHLQDDPEKIGLELKDTWRDLKGLPPKSDATAIVRKSLTPNLWNSLWFVENKDRASTPHKHAIDHMFMTETLAKILTKVQYNTDKTVVDPLKPAFPKEHGYILATFDIDEALNIHERDIIVTTKNTLESASYVDIYNHFQRVIEEIEKEINAAVAEHHKTQTMIEEKEQLKFFKDELNELYEERAVKFVTERDDIVAIRFVKGIMVRIKSGETTWRNVGAADKTAWVTNADKYKVFEQPKAAKSRATKRKRQKKKECVSHKNGGRYCVAEM